MCHSQSKAWAARSPWRRKPWSAVKLAKAGSVALACAITAPAGEGVALVGCRDVDGQKRALAVHRHMARTALDLFAAVKAARLAFRRALDALAPLGGRGEERGVRGPVPPHASAC